MKNKYIVRSRISEKKFREILRYFALDLEAKKIAEICKISRPCVNRILREIRILIAKECEKISAVKSKSMKVISVQGVCVEKGGVELVAKRLCSVC